MDNVSQNTLLEFAKLQSEVQKTGMTTDTSSIQPLLGDLVNAQAKALDSAMKYGTAASGDALNLWQGLSRILNTAKANKIHPAFVQSAVNVALGPTKDLPKAASTVKQYRSRFNNLAPIFLDEKRWIRATGNTKIESKDAAGNVVTKTLEGLTEVPSKELVAKLINTDKEADRMATQAGRLQAQFRDLLAEFAEQARKRIKAQAADEEAGTPALNAVEITDMIGYLKDCITDMPERTEVKADQTAGEKLEAAAQTAPASEAVEKAA